MFDSPMSTSCDVLVADSLPTPPLYSVPPLGAQVSPSRSFPHALSVPLSSSSALPVSRGTLSLSNPQLRRPTHKGASCLPISDRSCGLVCSLRFVAFYLFIVFSLKILNFYSVLKVIVGERGAF